MTKPVNIPESKMKRPSGKKSILESDPDFWAELTTFIAGAPDDHESLTLAASAVDFKRVRSRAEWLDICDQYPEVPLPYSDRKAMKSSAAKLRGVFALAAIRRILEISKAPKTLLADLDAFFQMPKPPSSRKRGRAQKAMIENPGASYAEVQAVSGYNKSEISRDLDKRNLFREA